GSGFGYEAGDSAAVNFAQARHLSGGFPAGRNGVDDFLALFGGDLRLASGNAALGSRFPVRVRFNFENRAATRRPIAGVLGAQPLEGGEEFAAAIRRRRG